MFSKFGCTVRLWAGAGLLLAVALSVAAASAQERGGTVVMIVQPEPPTLASYVSTAGPVGGLLEYDFNLKPQPGLAESWQVAADGKTITLKLRDGVKFHDGRPFTSEDVKFSIMDVLKKYHPRGQSTFREVTEIDTPDPHTAIVTSRWSRCRISP
jgi:peptide/nickel transport system substrate-binding protein